MTEAREFTKGEIEGIAGLGGLFFSLLVGPALAGFFHDSAYIVYGFVVGCLWIMCWMEGWRSAPDGRYSPADDVVLEESAKNWESKSPWVKKV
jgi:hypothetical protein